MRILIGILFVLALLPASVRAETTAGFLKSIAGTWRGQGVVYVSGKSKSAKIRCKITSTLSKARKKLRSKGKCATAQRKVRVSGTIGYSSGSNKVTGSYLGALGNRVVTRSSGLLKGNRLIFNTTFQDKQANKITKSRSIIRRLSARKFTITLFEKVGSSYVNRGKITFSK